MAQPTGASRAPATPRQAALARFFAPASIAVVGATEAPGLARDLCVTLGERHYPGTVYYVNPHRAEVLGQPAHPDVSSVPAPVDVAIVLVPPEATPAVVSDCARAKVAGVAIVTAGFAEMGPEGRALQTEIGRLAREAGLLLLGPNCIGFANVPRRIPAIAIPPGSVPAELAAGPVGVVSQSAGILISTMEYGSQVGVGFSTLISTGNEEQIDATDCLQYLLDDPQTRVIALVLETVRDGRRLLEGTARARALGKTVVALKLGRSTRGAEAAITHTAGLAGSAEVFDAACRDAGIESVATVSELVDHLAFHGKRRAGVRGGLAAITISGGVKVLVADLAERYGVRLADFSAETRGRLARVIPSVGVAGNPLDVTAAAIEEEEVFAQAVAALDADRDVGVIALIMHLKKRGGSPAHQRIIRRFAAQHGRATKQLAVISTIPEGVSGFWREESAASPVPFLSNLTALAALRSLTASAPGAGAAAQEAAPAATAAPSDFEATVKSKVLPRLQSAQIHARHHGDAPAAYPIVLGEMETYPLLEAAGIEVAPYERVQSRDDAVAAANRLGYPIVLKVTAPGVAHKTAAGLVRLDLRMRDDVARAYDVLAARPLPAGGRPAGVIVQAMVRGAVELLLGMRADPQFGPVITVGLGGVYTETLRDVQLALAPLDAGRARTLLETLRIGPLLRDLAARSQIDLDAAAGLVSRFSLLAALIAPPVLSLEINPLIATPRGCVAVDALAQLSPGD
jgi:acyl-CoA synthetase (NDP forming)